MPTYTAPLTNTIEDFPRTKAALARLLQRRDNITQEDALTMIEDFQQAVDDALDRNDYHGLDDLIQDELGLEPDYLILFI